MEAMGFGIDVPNKCACNARVDFGVPILWEDIMWVPMYSASAHVLAGFNSWVCNRLAFILKIVSFSIMDWTCSQ